MALQGRKQTKWKQSQQSIEHRQSWEPVLFFSHCGALGDFISNSPPAFGFYLCQVNWTEESGGSWNQAFFGSFRPPSKPFALGRLKHIPVPFYPPFLFLLVFPLSSRELIFIWCCVTLWWLRCTSLRPLFERDGAGVIWPDSWLCSQERTCYDEVQWQSRETSLCPVLDPLSPPLNLRWAIVVVKAKISLVLLHKISWCLLNRRVGAHFLFIMIFYSLLLVIGYAEI